MISVGKIKQYTNVLDKPLSRGRQEVILANYLAFGIARSSKVVANIKSLQSYSSCHLLLRDLKKLECICVLVLGTGSVQPEVDNIADLERRLEDAGYAVGARVLELLCHREKGNRRETRLLGILSFVHSTVWKVLSGKVADSLEKGTEHEDEYMISEKEELVNRFISIAKDMGAHLIVGHLWLG